MNLIKNFFNWKMLIVLLLGFSSGLPLALTAGTLQAWMSDLKIDLTIIGVFSLVGLPYAFKVLWAPILDRFSPPFFFSSLGRRRGWLLFFQLTLIILIAAMAFSNPAKAPSIVATLAVLVAFFSASQDTIIDAYKIELLDKSEYGIGAGINILGYRLAMIFSGGIAFIMADHFSWKTVYLCMSLSMLIGVITTLLSKENPSNTHEISAMQTIRSTRTFKNAVLLPFTEFFRRQGSIEILFFLILYKLDVMMTLAITTPFMLSLGFTKTEIGTINKGFGMIATIAGTLFGGGVLSKLGLEKSLWLFGIAQAASGFTYMLLAKMGHNFMMLITAITIENLCSGMGIAAFSAFIMSMCDLRFSATQYALLTSFMAISRYIASSPSGFLVEKIGWESYFAICALAGVPGLVLLTRFKKWKKPD